jgi:hypothetical protein
VNFSYYSPGDSEKRIPPMDTRAQQQNAMAEQGDVINYTNPHQPTHEQYSPYLIGGQYPGAPFAQPVSVVRYSLQKVAIWSIATHGRPGEVSCSNSAGIETGTLKSSDLSTDDCSKVLFAFVNACESAAIYNAPSTPSKSFITDLVEKGADGAVGFLYQTNKTYAKTFSNYFWRYVCKEGMDVGNATRRARDETWGDYSLYTDSQQKELSPVCVKRNDSEPLYLCPVRNGTP